MYYVHIQLITVKAFLFVGFQGEIIHTFGILLLKAVCDKQIVLQACAFEGLYTQCVCVRVFGTVSSMKFDEWIGVSVLRNLCTWVGQCEIGGMWQVQHYQLSMLFWAMVARSCRPSNEQSLVDSEQLVETISRQGSIPRKFIPTRLQFIFFCHHWSTAHLSCLSDQKPDWIKLWIIWSDLQCHYAPFLSCWPYSQPGERPGTRCALICLKACWMIRNSWGQKIEKLHQPERFKMGMLRCS